MTQKQHDDLAAARARLRELLEEHHSVGQDPFFGLRRRLRRHRGRSLSAIEWCNALDKSRKGELIRVPAEDEDAVVLVLYQDLARLRQQFPRPLVKLFVAPARMVARSA